jgi:hypothetical protein
MFIAIYVSRKELYPQLSAHFALARVTGVKDGPGGGAGVGSVPVKFRSQAKHPSFMDKAIGEWVSRKIGETMKRK